MLVAAHEGEAVQVLMEALWRNPFKVKSLVRSACRGIEIFASTNYNPGLYFGETATSLR